MRGFYWTANSPYIQGMWVRLRRAPRAPALSLDPSTGFIATPLPDGSTHFNANPGYLILECLTNTDWGMGGDSAEMDVLSFQRASITYRLEGLGLFMLWSKQSTIEDFIGDVLDHVQSVLFLDPSTGLIVLRPLRADYVVADLPVFDPDNCVVEDFDRRSIGETVNEIVVSWTNPLTEKTETVTAQDLAAIVQQGGQIISQPRNYYGIRTASVAAQLAARDLRTACAPLATFTLKATRAAFRLTPGQCFVLNWPEENVSGLVGRVQTIDYGNTDNGIISATCIEDVFALDAPVYTGAPGSGWQSPSAPPNPPGNVFLTTAPAFIVANSAEQFVEQPVYPEVSTLLLVSDPNRDFISYEPFTTVTLPTGDTAAQSIGTGQRTPFATLTNALPAEASSVVTSFSNPSGRAPRLADLAFIGNGEIALVQAIGTDGTYTLARGVLDTVPQAWPAGTPVWFVDTDARVLDAIARAPGETAVYRLLMRTSLGILAYAAAPDTAVTLTDRPYRPLRPANVKVNGQGFGTVALAGTAASVSWSNRNRLLETSQILGWSAGSVAAESGQTTTVRVLRADGSVLFQQTGLTGTSYNVPPANLVGGSTIEVASVRDGLVSLQAFRVAYTT